MPSPAGATFAVVSRGLCTFTEKIAAIELAGYDAAIVVNREGFDGCGPFGMTVDGGIPAFSIERSAGFDLFDVDGLRQRRVPGGCDGDSSRTSESGRTGDDVTLTSFFDGWGYVHLYRNAPGKLQELDTFAIPEAMDPATRGGLR